MVVGTVGYMSPEQAEAKTPDARSDQFSFCICLWEALYGKRPFTGTSVSEVTKALLEGTLPARPRGTQVPNWLHSVLVRGLQRDPHKRYPSMEALLKDLDRAPDEWARRVLPWAAVAAVLVLVGGLQLSSRARERGKCEAVSGELAGVWDDALRARLATAFGKVTKPFAAAALASAERALDSHAREWTTAATQSCEQAYVRKEIPEADYRLEAACLAQRRRELAAVVNVLSTADEGVVERAGTLAWSLTPVRGCTQLARLKADPRLTTSGADETKVVALQADLARARTLIDAGKLADAAPVVEQALASAKELNRRALEAEALSLLGNMHQAAGKYPDAIDAWTRTAMAAQASGFDELMAMAAVRLTTLVGFYLNKPADGRLWDSLARATIERMGGDDILTLERMTAVARLGNAEGKPIEVAQQHQQALALAKTLLGADHPLLWKIEFDYGQSLMAAKDWPGAVTHLERSLELREREVSGDHPEAAMVRSALANAYFFVGRVADSGNAFTRAIATREKLFGVESPRLVVPLNNFADTLTKVGRHEEAFALVTRAVTIAKKAYPAGHPVVVATLLTHAEIQFALGHRDDAGKELEAVLSMQPAPIAPYLAEAGAVRASIALADNKPKDAFGFATKAVEAGTQVGARSPELMQPLLARGESELALKDSAAAVKTLELALSIVEETKPWPVSLADVQFALARAKSAAKAEGAKQLAEDALAIYRASAGQDAKTKSVEEFLAH
jgi:tetratricopeptide (TPR) repeat protein